MERRRESRVSTNRFGGSAPARIYPLEKDALAFEATLADISGSGMRFVSTQALAPDTALKIEIGDALVLAEVVHCRRAADGSFNLGVRVDQVLSSLADLLRLQNTLLEQQDSRPAALPTSHR